MRVRTAFRIRNGAISNRVRGSPDAGYGDPAYLAHMHLVERNRDPLDHEPEESTEEGPALREATEVAARAAADEEAAAAARDRFRIEPVPPIEADAAVQSHLEPGELVHALRKRAILSAPGGDGGLGYGGTLYLTSRRLVLLGQVVISVRLTDIDETSLAGERLLLTLRNGEGLALDLDRPRLLRAEMAALGVELRR